MNTYKVSIIVIGGDVSNDDEISEVIVAANSHGEARLKVAKRNPDSEILSSTIV